MCNLLVVVKKGGMNERQREGLKERSALIVHTIYCNNQKQQKNVTRNKQIVK